jgi:hypothetical protein
MTFLILPFLLWSVGFDDDEDKTKYWNKRIHKLFEDISVGIKPTDILRPLREPFPALTKTVEMMDGITEFLTEGIGRGKTDSRGLPKGLYTVFRSVPLGSSIHQWNYFMKDLKEKDLIL